MARLSRRTLVASMGATPLLNGAPLPPAVAADPVLLLCGQYADLTRRGDMLLLRWSDYEGWLGKNRNYYRLSDEEAKKLPEAQLLFAIDEEYHRCLVECTRLMRRIRSIPAVTIAGAIAKLSIAAEAIDPDDFPSGHRVLVSAISDLRTMRTDR